MNLYKLGLKILNSYREKDFEKTLKYIDKYLSNKENGIYSGLLHMYIVSLINLSRREEALNYIELACNYWPNIYTTSQLVELYIMCGDCDSAENILRKKTNDFDLYYNAARAYLLYGYYYSAKYWFKYILSKTNDQQLIEKVKKYISEINNYINNSTFIQTSYINYKNNGKKLEPGQIIYQNSKYLETTDSKASKRPYVIWKVEDEKVYCFPVESKKDEKKPYNYVLMQQYYPNFDFDRIIRDEVICVDEKRIEKIIDIVRPYDYENILKNVYSSYCFRHEFDNCGFVKHYASNLNIQKGDIIMIYNNDDCSRNYYIVESVNNDTYGVYETISDGENYTIKNDKLIYFTNNDFIIKKSTNKKLVLK